VGDPAHRFDAVENMAEAASQNVILVIAARPLGGRDA
jgi:hypothetical protein